MEYTINRSVKRPGLIVGARTMFIQLNDKGLYVICLGNATQTPRPTNDLIVNLVADKAVDFFQNRYEKKIRETEARIKTESLDDLAKGKLCYFIPTNEITFFKASIEPDSHLKIQMKGGKLNMKVYTHPYYQQIAESIESLINKAK
jgi:hypothetical protein